MQLMRYAGIYHPVPYLEDKSTDDLLPDIRVEFDLLGCMTIALANLLKDRLFNRIIYRNRRRELHHLNTLMGFILIDKCRGDLGKIAFAFLHQQQLDKSIRQRRDLSA